MMDSYIPSPLLYFINTSVLFRYQLNITNLFIQLSYFSGVLQASTATTIPLISGVYMAELKLISHVPITILRDGITDFKPLLPNTIQMSLNSSIGCVGSKLAQRPVILISSSRSSTNKCPQEGMLLGQSNTTTTKHLFVKVKRGRTLNLVHNKIMLVYFCFI